MRSHSYINTIQAIIGSYDGVIPLAPWLKQYFKLNKKIGSTDRKQIAHACYCFYRLGNAFLEKTMEEQILIGLFLCSDASVFILKELKPEWNENIHLTMDEKIAIASTNQTIKNIFPFPDEISKEIDREYFNRSFLIQPDLFLRIRPGKKQKLITQLENEKIHFAIIGEDVLRIPNGTKIEILFHLDEDVVVQDLNSQKVLKLLAPFIPGDAVIKIWDCCAASGGKTILSHDTWMQADLTVSDIRKTILINLQNRFERAGIKKYDHFICDVSSSAFSFNKKFDLVICDAPCSGSGTWSRTPEQLKFFKKEKIAYYSDLQKKIIANVVHNVKQNGWLLYITCSVFEMENEAVVQFALSNLSLELESLQYYKGYDQQADNLFVALFRVL